jgi:hypothetical protein
VSQLKLKIRPPKKEEQPYRIKVGDGEERQSPGSVVLEWKEGKSFNDIDFRVRCSVYDHDNIRKIVFGASFLERRKRYF